MKPQKNTCENCGKDYYSICNGRNKFCSNKCKSAYRRKIGVDNIEKKCIKCGEKFEVYKYSKRKQKNPNISLHQYYSCVKSANCLWLVNGTSQRHHSFANITLCFGIRHSDTRG